MDTDPANAPLLPMPTAVAPPPLVSCERRHCRLHAAEGVHKHRLSDSGQQAVTLMAGAMERFELQLLGWVTREVGPVDVPILGDRFAVPNRGTRQSWPTIRGTTKGQSRWSASRWRRVCRCGACFGRRGWKERRRRASTWPFGRAAKRLGSPTTARVLPRLQCPGPMPFWWRCTQKAWRLCSRMAKSSYRR